MGMPRRTELPTLTGTAADAYQAIRVESRLLCLRFLLSVESASRAEMSEATSLNTTTTTEAIRELEQLGYVVSDTQGVRRGLRPRYRARRDTVTADLLSLVGWVIG